MSQHLSMLPSQQMRLEQRLTPQLIQSMEILQLPLMALEARVREELETNPVLEEVEPEKQPDTTPREDLPASEANQAEAEGFERLERMAREMEFDPGDLPYARGSGSAAGERDAKIDAMANTACRGEGLKERLLHDWALVEARDKVKQAGEVLIDWMDEDGYLRREAEHHPRHGNGDVAEARPLIIRRSEEETDQLMEEIAQSRTPPVDRAVLDEALGLVQTMEPLGVGARDLSECLLIQIEALECDDPLVRELIEKHLVDLGKNRFPQVAKAVGGTIEEVKQALEIISHLHHHPGLLVQSTDVQRIAPDIIVDYADEGDGYTIRLARGTAPKLCISPQYRRMLRDRSQSKEAREFIRRRLEAASTIIDAIAYRRQRLLQLAEVIIDRQRDFFDYGPQHLKVLRMRDIAEAFGCDPSTISRSVDGKYMQTPRGIYPLRMFFTGGTEDASGESVSWNSLKEKVKQIIDNEDKSNPLADDEIAKRLESEDVRIARRTVAKYRVQLGIPTARERREY